jgi:hypothetical protein
VTDNLEATLLIGSDLLFAAIGIVGVLGLIITSRKHRRRP